MQNLQCPLFGLFVTINHSPNRKVDAILNLSIIMRITVRTLPSFIVTILLAFSCATPANSQTLNPLEGNGRAIFGGATLFRAQCATCHGADAKGISSIDAPDLTLMWAERQRSAQEVFDIVKNGIPGSIMPAHGFTDTELWMLVAFLQDAAISGVVDLPQGDADNGQALFINNCAECHRVNGEGGALGPNLTGISQRRFLESLLSSVRNPSAQIAPGYKPVEVTTSNNLRIKGVLKNEDAFSLQMMTENHQLRAFSKTDIRQLDRLQNSLMPTFSDDELSEEELIDIINFLDRQ